MKNDLLRLAELNKIRSVSITLKEGEFEELQIILQIPFNKHIDLFGIGKEKISVILVYRRNNINYGCGYRGEARKVIKNVYEKLLNSDSMYLFITSPKLKEEWFIKKEIIE